MKKLKFNYNNLVAVIFGVLVVSLIGEMLNIDHLIVMVLGFGLGFVFPFISYEEDENEY